MNSLENIEGFEYPHEISQNPLKSTLNSFEKMGYSKSSISDLFSFSVWSYFYFVVNYN